MMRDIDTVERYCELTDAETALLRSAAAPVVLLRMREEAVFPDGVAPGLRQIGVMLPYTPLHKLLFDGPIDCMVMTSGNMTEEPIVIGNDDAKLKLAPLADRLLTHDRDIFMRVDDSVTRVFEGAPRVLRRARGYAPSAIRLAHEVPDVLAVGAELKNTFCITKGRYAIPSQHIGDLENLETLEFFEETLRNLQSVYQAKPQLLIHDLHPDYLGTKWALRQSGPKLAVQHHFAHVASCMAENGLTGNVIGVAFDGTGFGTDAQIWGGEFLVCDYHGFRRWAHLRYVPLPGGDRAARQGWRMAASHLYDAMGHEAARKLDLPCWSAAPAAAWKIVDHLIRKPTIQTSSCGRLFDAVSAICGISLESGYEGESAMLLEGAATAASSEGSYEIGIDRHALPWTIDTRPMIEQIATGIATGHNPQHVARCFHRAIANMIGAVVSSIRAQTGIERVCLSGGTFQNPLLLEGAVGVLRSSGFEVFLHSQVPPNDGGISLGQAVIGAASIDPNTTSFRV
jgi:hydrogenase maturation protein HypF